MREVVRLLLNVRDLLDFNLFMFDLLCLENFDNVVKGVLIIVLFGFDDEEDL